MEALKSNLKRKGKNLVVLDIGSQFLKALFLEIDKKEGRGILRAWVREKINDLDKLYLVSKKAINKVEKKAGLKTEQIFLGIGREIVKGNSISFCYQRENPKQKIDLAELKYLVHKIQWKGFDKIRKIFALETGLPETEVKLINAHIINIRVDGNSIDNPLGFQGKEICLTIFNTYTSAQWLEDLVKLSSKLGLELRGINSPSYALFHCLNLEDIDEDILIIDVGGKITELTLVKKGGEIAETRSFNLGGYSFTKILADFLDLGTDEAEAVKMKYIKKEVSSEARGKIDKLISSNISSWLGGVKVVLLEFLKKYKSRPQKIFLCGRGSNLPGLKKELEKKGGFQIKFISPIEIVKLENRTKLQDIPCLALAQLALESSEDNLFSSTLKRVVRLIQE